MNVARMIEVAEHNDFRVGGALIVFDSLTGDRPYGIRCELEPAATAVGGWVAYTRDGVGNSHLVWKRDREEAVRASLDGYLRIVNQHYRL